MTLRELDSLYESLTPERGTGMIQAIKAASTDSDINTLLLIGKVESFVTAFRDEGRRLCAEGRGMSPSERDTLTLHGRILAALILILHKSSSTRRLREYLLLFLSYSAAAVRTGSDFLPMALDVVCHKVKRLGLDWHILQEATSLDLLSYKLLAGTTFDRSVSETLSVRGRGQLFCRGGVLSVSSSGALESGSRAFSVCGDRVGVYTRNVRDERLKSAAQADAASLRSFASTFLRVQEEGDRRGGPRREYQDGEAVDIEILSLSEGGDSLECRVVGEGDVPLGTLIDEELIKGVRTSDLMPYFCELDCIRGALLYKDGDRVRFSIGDAYASYARRVAEKDFRENTCFQAKVYNVNDTWGRVNWITPSGYCGITKSEDTPGVKVGDVRILQVLNVQRQGAHTYVNLCAPRFDVDGVRRFAGEEDILKDFVTTRETILAEREKDLSQETVEGGGELEALAAILASPLRSISSIETYRRLLVALFLTQLRGDREALGRLRAEAEYLCLCLCFAQDSPQPTPREAALPADREAVARMLLGWERPSPALRDELLCHGADTVPGQVAALMYGAVLADEYRDELKADRDKIRRRICEILGVGDAFEASGGLRRGKYGSVEGQEVEFKSSYVFRNDGGGADLEAQGRGEVFEAVCGFLNADGGVLYLGVGDQGDPILARERGLWADKAWLRDHRNQVNRDRFERLGHSTLPERIGVEGDLDSYVQFLNGEKELFFKEAFWGNITIEVTPDCDAIKMEVEPARYEVAYLYSDRKRSDGEAYVRDGGRTVPMTRVRKEQRLSELKQLAKEMGFVVTIQEAIDRHQRLIFKDYASGNSGQVADRLVVPVNLFYNDENVYCLDLASRKYKQFRLHRIGSIEPAEDTSPYPLPAMEPLQADVFRWLPEGKRSYHVRLRMDVAARNCLLEEYSCAETLPREEFYEEKNNKWVLDTHVNGLGAVRRFYLGLADKIEILESEDAEALREEIASFAGKHIIGR